jgi:GNAT superfamily N-acetyltransferase
VVIRFAGINEYPEVLTHYKICNYNGGVEDEDIIVIAIDKELIGAVRICSEYGIQVLRGMQIKSAWQKKGLGSSMLKFLVDNVDMNGCYCLPYKHLKSFYASTGFEEIAPQNAPVFLVERLEKYLSSGIDVIMMMVNKTKLY